jgi:predicted nuclease of predicted toxin-antitoxin system
VLRFLADENFPGPSIRLLRAAAHDVLAVAESMPSVSDPAVLTRSTADDRILLTSDKDYGSLVFRLGLDPPAGVVFFRLGNARPEEHAELLLEFIDRTGSSLVGLYTTVTRRLVRQRPLA